MYLRGLKIKSPEWTGRSPSGAAIVQEKLLRRMNASKAKKEASEKKIFLNQKIAHDIPFLIFFFQYVKSFRLSSFFFFIR
jgi:hypothetical protein